MDALVAEAIGRQPPAGAFTVQQFAEKTGLGFAAADGFLRRKVKAGELVGDKLQGPKGTTWFFWPSSLG